MTEDREGEALEAEIAADRREARERAKRRVLFLPPLVALTVAAWALGASRPREVCGVRAWVGAQPPHGAPLHLRVELVKGVPGIEGTSSAPHVELRVTKGRAEATDDEGIAELTVDAPLPSDLAIEAKIGARGEFRPVGSVSTKTLPQPDPKDGAIALRRSGGAQSGAYKVEAWPEKGALAPPIAGAAWVRVRDLAGAPIEGAAITTTPEAGIGNDPAPATTDASGLARVALTPIAPPVMVTFKAERAGTSGTWHGLLGAVQGVPAPESSRLVKGAPIELVASSSRTSAYYELFQHGVRIGGGRAVFDRRRAFVALPADVTGAIDLLTSTSASPPSADDLAHVGSWPIVIAADAVEAFGVVDTEPRFDPKITKAPGPLSGYDAVVAATIAAAAPAIPSVHLAADTLRAELDRETARGRTVRRAASLAVVGGGLVEFGLMLGLGVLRKPSIAEDLSDLDEEGEEKPVDARPNPARYLAIVVTALGIIALVFAALATMAWGLPS